MQIEYTALLTVALMYISYQVGNLLGKSEAYHAGFIKGASDGIDKILHVLKIEYGIIMGYDDILIETDNKVDSCSDTNAK